MSPFPPCLEILPPEQRRLWPRLSSVPGGFVLYGGTALALRLGHRPSADFDFFSAEPFQPETLKRQLPFAAKAEVLQAQANTLSLRCAAPEEVKLSFFGGLSLAQVEDPDGPMDNGVWVASPRDLMATKLNVLFQRAEAKDYLDVHALLRTGLTLTEGLGCARGVYGPAFNPTLPLKALTFFADGDLPTLPANVRDSLKAAVRAVSEIPNIACGSPRISPPHA